MLRFVVLSALVACSLAGPVMHAASDGVNYNFNYATGDAGGHARTESGTAGAVSGKYSYVDPNGNHREVRYTADAGGFKAEGDISVDKKTADDAAVIASLAPKAPEPLAHPFSHVSHLGALPYYGHHLGHGYSLGLPHAYSFGLPHAYSYGYSF